MQLRCSPLGVLDNSRNSRFFVLEAGELSFMDTTSKKPPFSMSHRQLTLRGKAVTCDGLVIKLSGANLGTEQDQSWDTAVVLEVKSAAAQKEWVDALAQHIAYFY
mmetsp:Transcript_556/g.1083  ORF Transcript_556/g.1083 Transcript_556/m.1083 type:complete len:105 (+) Transcript_556:84-398(+)